MNYYGAREIAGPDGQGTGRFHFTRRNDDQIHAVGYCAEGCPGHPTEAAAAAHYHEWLLANRLRFHANPDGDMQERCVADGCGAWTTGYGELDMAVYPLCPLHRTRAVMETVTSPAAAIVSSW